MDRSESDVISDPNVIAMMSQVSAFRYGDRIILQASSTPYAIPPRLVGVWGSIGSEPADDEHSILFILDGFGYRVRGYDHGKHGWWVTHEAIAGWKRRPSAKS
jgi:hypothetical protein